MKYRKLRIAWSVAWGVVALLLCLLWVRSYWWVDSISCQAHSYIVISNRGYWTVIVFSDEVGENDIDAIWSLSTERASGWALPYPHGITGSSQYTRCCLPFWILAMPAAMFATAPWLRWRFSLRTLLIATTLVAVGLGLIVWLAN